ncbi:hypothetical protein JDV02_008882 [Purpureocillium takamizusanense]|uniref:Uncharacterized protein n=1 Tax=Purpureocillium takamizusanense TaxID=2060973 RepID=A0A9Q8QQQ9_9HYPO|nr:uncharacterized protein JDV02_008882 [Purpureocillium takamizusanense]UNI23039.1 hypothetical protein JDV02_008882 [Purpureocillium takamizusanense]
MAALDDLFAADAKLRALADDSDQLQDARRRFETTPPVYRSRPSVEITQLNSPGPATEGERRLRDGRARLFFIKNHRANSWPDCQFRQQKSAEVGFRIEKWRKRYGPRCYGMYDDTEIAELVVRERWREWGIWSEHWEREPEGRWKTDVVVPVDDSRPELDAEAGAETSDGCSSRDHQSSPGREREPVQTARGCDDDNSRPYNLFLLLVGVERQRLRYRLGTSVDPHDINTQAYNAVKEQWEREGIWRTTWGTLPGMTWKHEHLLKDIIDEEACLTLEELDHTRYYSSTEVVAAFYGADDSGTGTPRSVRSASPTQEPQDAKSPYAFDWSPTGPVQGGPETTSLPPIRFPASRGLFDPIERVQSPDGKCDKRPGDGPDVEGETEWSREPDTSDMNKTSVQISRQFSSPTLGADRVVTRPSDKVAGANGPVGHEHDGSHPEMAPSPPLENTVNARGSPADLSLTVRKSPKRKRASKTGREQPATQARPPSPNCEGPRRRSKRLAARETTASPVSKGPRRGKPKAGR